MEMTPEDVLGFNLGENDSGADTVRGYLVSLLEQLWHEGEGFSGKRPFGNSDWQSDLEEPLKEAGVKDPYMAVYLAIQAL